MATALTAAAVFFLMSKGCLGGGQILQQDVQSEFAG